MCVLCVQHIDNCQRHLQDPSTDERRRSALEGLVQDAKNRLQRYNASIAEADAGILELVRERSAISLKQGEPLGCHADDCRVWLPQ